VEQSMVRRVDGAGKKRREEEEEAEGEEE